MCNLRDEENDDDGAEDNNNNNNNSGRTGAGAGHGSSGFSRLSARR